MLDRGNRIRRRILIPILAGLLLAGSHPAEAEEPELTIEEVVVSASRLPDAIQELRRVPGQVYAITREEIERTKPRTVQEALRQVPGIVLYDLNGNGFQSTVDLRGFNGQPSPGVSVFVDGVRVNEADSNAVNFDLIPIQDVERIEVLPGATALFGRNSLGGVINILTKRGTKTPQTTVEGAWGSYDHYRVSANTSGPWKALDYYLGMVWDRESGFRAVSDGRLTRLTGRLGYRPSDDTDLSIGYGYVNDRLEQAGTLRLIDLALDRRRNLTPGDFYANELSSVTLQGRQKIGWGLSVAGNAFHRGSSREGVSYFAGGFFRGITDTDTTGGTLQLSHEADVFGRTSHFVVGGELSHSGVNTASAGTFGPGKRLIDEEAPAFFAQETFDLTKELSLTAAVRYDSTKVRFEDELAPGGNGEKRYSRLTPRAGLTYTPWSALTLYANYGEGYRVPTTDELFAFAGFGSNPDLKPVKSRGYEVGLRARPVGWVEFRGALFLTDVQDEIVFDPLVAPFGQNRNAPESRRQGFELEAKLRPHASLDLALNYSLTDAKFRTGVAPVEKGDRVPLVPLHRLNGTLTYRPVQGLELAVDGQYVSRQVLLNDEANQWATRVQDAFVLNARASYQWKWFTWFIRGNNLTDWKYETYGVLGGFPTEPYFMPAPGINVLGGVTVRFDGYY